MKSTCWMALASCNFDATSIPKSVAILTLIYAKSPLDESVPPPLLHTLPTASSISSSQSTPSSTTFLNASPILAEVCPELQDLRIVLNTRPSQIPLLHETPITNHGLRRLHVESLKLYAENVLSLGQCIEIARHLFRLFRHLHSLRHPSHCANDWKVIDACFTSYQAVIEDERHGSAPQHVPRKRPNQEDGQLQGRVRCRKSNGKMNKSSSAQLLPVDIDFGTTMIVISRRDFVGFPQKFETRLHIQ